MCKKCEKHSKYWVHIADDWTEEEAIEMLWYIRDHFFPLLQFETDWNKARSEANGKT